MLSTECVAPGVSEVLLGHEVVGLYRLGNIMHVNADGNAHQHVLSYATNPPPPHKTP